MDIKKGLNQIIKYKPTYVKSIEDVKDVTDFLVELRNFKRAVEEKYKEEKAEIESQLAKIDTKYKEVLDKIEEIEGEFKGKVINYANGVINSGQLLEKKVEGEKGTLIFVADKVVEVTDVEALIKAIAEGKYPTTLVKPQPSELKKYAKATQRPIDGCEVKDTVYFMIR